MAKKGNGAQVSVRLDGPLLAELDAYVKRAEKTRPGTARADVIRELIVDGLVRRAAPQPTVLKKEAP